MYVLLGCFPKDNVSFLILLLPASPKRPEEIHLHFSCVYIDVSFVKFLLQNLKHLPYFIISWTSLKHLLLSSWTSVMCLCFTFSFLNSLIKFDCLGAHPDRLLICIPSGFDVTFAVCVFVLLYFLMI